MSFQAYQYQPPPPYSTHPHPSLGANATSTGVHGHGGHGHTGHGGHGAHTTHGGHSHGHGTPSSGGNAAVPPPPTPGGGGYSIQHVQTTFHHHVPPHAQPPSTGAGPSPVGGHHSHAGSHNSHASRHPHHPATNSASTSGSKAAVASSTSGPVGGGPNGSNANPSTSTVVPTVVAGQGTVAPGDTYTQPPPPPVRSQASVVPGGGASGSSTNIHSHPQHQSQQQQQQQHQQGGSNGLQGGSHVPLIAQGDWTKNLVHLAKTAELKKHALTLQLHTAHILSAHAALDAKNKALQDIKEQKNRLESERARLINCLREVNEDRDKADLLEHSIGKECGELRSKIQQITEGEYAVAKREVDGLRAELGQAPLPSLEKTLEEKSTAYLNERRMNGESVAATTVSSGSPGPLLGTKRGVEAVTVTSDGGGKRPRGRPKGSKNKAKQGTTDK